MKQKEFIYLFIGFTLGSIIGFCVGILPSLKDNSDTKNDINIKPRSTSREDMLKMMRNKMQNHLEEWKKELEKNPDNYDLLIKLAGYCNKLENYQEAVIFYQRALNISAKDPNILNDFGVVLERLNKLPEAVMQFEKARQIAPSHPQTLHNLLRIKIMRQAPIEEVRSDYQNLKKLDPKSPQIPIGLGVTYYYVGNLNETLFYLKEALYLEPNNMQCLTYLGRVYEKNHQPKEALAIYERLLQLLPEEHRDMLLQKIESLKRDSTSDSKQNPANK